MEEAGDRNGNGRDGERGRGRGNGGRGPWRGGKARSGGKGGGSHRGGRRGARRGGGGGNGSEDGGGGRGPRERGRYQPYRKRGGGGGGRKKASFRQELEMAEVGGQEEAWQGVRVRLASYNLLADSVLFKHRSLYRKIPLSALKWVHRRAAIVEQLCELSADVYAVQEYECQRSGLSDVLYHKGYRTVGELRSRNGLNLDGCGFFFKADTIDLVRWQVIELNAVEGTAERFDDVSRRLGPMAGLLNRNNVAIVALFCAKKGDTLFCAVNTHLLFNPRRGEVKLSQILLLLDDVKLFLRLTLGEELATKTPLVFLGDCNLLPHSRLYHFLSDGSLSLSGDHWAATLSGQEDNDGGGSGSAVVRSGPAAEEAEYRGYAVTVETKGTDLHVRHDMDWKSVYLHGAAAEESSRKCGATTIVDNKKGTVDYIFFTPKNVRLAAVLPLPSVADLPVLPTPDHPSDHLMIAADFYLRANA